MIDELVHAAGDGQERLRRAGGAGENDERDLGGRCHEGIDRELLTHVPGTDPAAVGEGVEPLEHALPVAGKNRVGGVALVAHDQVFILGELPGPSAVRPDAAVLLDGLHLPGGEGDLSATGVVVFKLNLRVLIFLCGQVDAHRLKQERLILGHEDGAKRHAGRKNPVVGLMDVPALGEIGGVDVIGLDPEQPFSMVDADALHEIRMLLLRLLAKRRQHRAERFSCLVRLLGLPLF